MKKYGSRKFIALCAQLLILIILPVVYIKMGLSELIIMTIIGTTCGCFACYLGVNVLSKGKTDESGG